MSQQTITRSEQKALKSQAHHLKPIILLGQKGITDAVIMETNRALTDHELIKVRLTEVNRQKRRDEAEKLAQACEATVVQVIGHVATLFRQNPESSSFLLGINLDN